MTYLRVTFADGYTRIYADTLDRKVFRELLQIDSNRHCGIAKAEKF